MTIFNLNDESNFSRVFWHSTQAKAPRLAFTLVEMLVAISITLVMMATVVGVFATISTGVSNRQAAIEVGNQVRHVRNVLQRDLEGATCPALPWTRPNSNAGYFEIVEGYHCDFFPSDLTDTNPGNGEIDHTTSTIPASNLAFTLVSGQEQWATDGGGLGDYDDILAFTSRNETEPFSGPAPQLNVQGNNQPFDFANWRTQTITSPLAEVVWFCVENPDPTVTFNPAASRNYFGEAGFRTIYRRTLLIAPWLDYNYDVDPSGAKSRPGVLRVMQRLDDPNDDQARALAALIAFQERYDISARIEFDRTINGGRWTIKANTLADLTKRENRYEHHARVHPYPMVAANGNAPGGTPVVDPEFQTGIRPFVNPNDPITPRAVINEQGQVVHYTTGLVPLSITGPNQSRRGSDLMLSQALGFDIQVYDPQAPVCAIGPNGTPIQANARVSPGADITSVSPADSGWISAIASSNALVVGNGAYVDLGYAALHSQIAGISTPPISSPFAGLCNLNSRLNDNRLTRTYCTWNFGYENDGLDQDTDGLVDEGTDGFDSPANYVDGTFQRLGPDDMAERETSPPYPAPLRAVQIKLRAFEPDSGQIREVTVRQHFVPE